MVIRTAKRLVGLAPAGLSARAMLMMPPLIAMLSPRHRTRYDLLRRLSPDGPRILSGPFKGMTYLAWSVGSPLLPKIVGTYEMELHSAVEKIIAMNTDAVMDIGSGEGYYVVGLARRLPSARVVGFDIDPMANALCDRLANENSVRNRITLRKWCTADILNEELSRAQRPVVICDTEGAEDEILRPDTAGQLKRASILVELHDPVRPAVSQRIRERFEATHEIETIRQQERLASMLEKGHPDLSNEERLLAMDECRGSGQEWFWMVPKPAGSVSQKAH
jgi:23S rRNA U2552 (ribose-2'-O)-methylase RlmE/FtsJ